MAASHYNLNNLIVFVDHNKLQSCEYVAGVMDTGNVQHKFEAFGWNVVKIVDGHDFDQLLDGVEKAFNSNRRPVMLWCHTVANKGIEFAEGKDIYHRVHLSRGELDAVIPKLKQLV